MMGRLKSDQGQLFHEFHLGEAVIEDHLVRKIDAALDLSWLRNELAPHYSSMGRIERFFDPYEFDWDRYKILLDISTDEAISLHQIFGVIDSDEGALSTVWEVAA